MTKAEYQELIVKKITGQGNQVAPIGGAFNSL